MNVVLLIVCEADSIVYGMIVFIVCGCGGFHGMCGDCVHCVCVAKSILYVAMFIMYGLGSIGLLQVPDAVSTSNAAYAEPLAAACRIVEQKYREQLLFLVAFPIRIRLRRLLHDLSYRYWSETSLKVYLAKLFLSVLGALLARDFA